MGILELRAEGLFCEAGGFFIDPWCPVDRAIVTHAHSDHARPGSASYLTAREGVGVLRARLGESTSIQPLDYGDSLRIGDAIVSLHPAGHILGSAQVRVESAGETWVVTGDYKTAPDSTCAPFEQLRCHVLVTEATFALPIYRWAPPEATFGEINRWWAANRDAGLASILYGYALGKAQRLIAGVDSSIGPIFTHGAVERLNRIYRQAGVALPETSPALDAPPGSFPGSLIVAPPGAQDPSWIRRFGPSSSAMASGWMTIRGTRRRISVDRGFALSDHADWPGLLNVIRESGAETVWVTHGQSASLVRWLRESGTNAHALATRFEGETADSGESAAGSSGAAQSSQTEL